MYPWSPSGLVFSISSCLYLNSPFLFYFTRLRLRGEGFLAQTMISNSIDGHFGWDGAISCQPCVHSPALEHYEPERKAELYIV